MMRKKLADLFYEILIDFPQEINQLLTEYMSIFPITYSPICEFPSDEFRLNKCEVIPGIGIVMYDSKEFEYFTINLKTNCVERVHIKSGYETLVDSASTYCQINKKGNDFIINFCDQLCSLDGDLLVNKRTDGLCEFVVDSVNDSIYMYSNEGIREYPLLDSKPIRPITRDNVCFVGKLRGGYIVQNETTNSTMHTFLYDEEMKNPVELSVPYESIYKIIETKKHVYIIDTNLSLFIDNKEYKDLPDNFAVLGIYHDHLIGTLSDTVDDSVKIVLLLDSNNYITLYHCKLPIQDIKCFDNEIYVLTSSSIFKLVDDLVMSMT